MVRIGAIFIAVCMVLIAGSLGVIVYLRFGLTGAESAIVAFGILTGLAAYNSVAARSRDRAAIEAEMTGLLRSSGDIARQVAEFERRLGGIEAKVTATVDKALSAAQPLAAEIEELSGLVKQLAESVAAHEAVLSRERGGDQGAPPAQATGAAEPAAGHAQPADAAPAATASPPRQIAAFGGLDRDAIIAAVRSAIDAQRIDLYLQPIVTLPQRKVRYYEAMSRLKAGNGDIVAAGDFLSYAEAGSLVPKLDRLSVLRCVQLVRRLLMKNREIGLFCNLSGATLTEGGFPQLLEFLEANRALAPSLVFEFTQSAVRAMGPIELESLAALAERGFRFSMDNLADLRVEPRELTDRGFRFVKAPAVLLLNRAGPASTDIHPADFSDLLGRFGIDLIAERIESETTVVDLLDYDVRFGQGFLFSPPRPVRAEALELGGPAGKAGSARTDGQRKPASGSPNGAAAGERQIQGETVALPRAGGMAQLARGGQARK